MNKDSFEWEALEYEHREKSADWFWALGIIAVSTTITAIIFGNVLFGLLILLGTFVLSIYAAKRPEVVLFRIDAKGILIGKKLYPYKTLDSFWVKHETEQQNPKLFIQSNKLLVPQIVIPLLNVDSSEIHSFLSNYMEEEEHEEPLSEIVLKFFGF